MSVRLDQYRELRRRLDTKFTEIKDRNPSSFACRLGCHSCCKPGLTVNSVEREEIREFFESNSARREAAAALIARNPHRGKRCGYLNEEGACLIYEVRPLVCRSHGAPLQFLPLGSKKETDVRLRDVCPLNFKDQDIGILPATDVLNLDTINTLLALLAPDGVRHLLVEDCVK